MIRPDEQRFRGALRRTLHAHAGEAVELQATRGEHSLGHAMVLIGIVNVWAAAHYFFAARRYRADLAATADLDAAI